MIAIHSGQHRELSRRITRAIHIPNITSLYAARDIISLKSDTAHPLLSNPLLTAAKEKPTIQTVYITENQRTPLEAEAIREQVGDTCVLLQDVNIEESAINIAKHIREQYCQFRTPDANAFCVSNLRIGEAHTHYQLGMFRIS
ncbi:MAG: hypothetical protein OXR66_02610 [Candidatus Woesearchaeota archaeon]|nr:hypothetical protein [Candidatus Woesearchaeota archaeon]